MKSRKQAYDEWACKSLAGSMGTESYGKLLGSSQAMGLLAVLAVSGSVALLTLGRQKLWHHVFYTNDNRLDCSDCNASNPIAETMLASSSRQHVCGSQKFDDNNPMLPRVLQASEVPCLGKKVRPIILKKVRFAPDVVEPAGDGQAYRWKNKVVPKISNKKACAYKQEQHKRLYKNNALSSNAGPNSPINARRQVHKAQTLAKPDLPANRMVLYNGMQSLDCRHTLDEKQVSF